MKRELEQARFTSILVKNIDPSMTNEEFHNIFSDYGSILSSSRSRGFVRYATHGEAKRAISALHNSEHHG
ncbi:hypothetical protein C0991_004192, partial [Blastosporella zonata]